MAEMSIEELEDLAAAFGADPSFWPDDRRKGARDLLSGPRGAEARAVLAEARRLDAALEDLGRAEALAPLPEALTARILADAAEISAGRPKAPAAPRRAGNAPRAGRSWLGELAAVFGGWRTAAISAAACALIGLGAGYATPDAAVAALGYDGTEQDQLIADLGWDLEEDESGYGLFGDAG